MHHKNKPKTITRLKKKLYISLPISGRNLDDVIKRANHLRDSVVSEYYEAVTPFDICPDSTRPYSELMGRDIAGLLECDAILFDNDWNTSKGCRTEMAVAQIYGIPIYHISNDEFEEDTENRLHRMELTKRQLQILSDACDNYSRCICGQLDVALDQIIWKGLDRTYTTATFDRKHEIQEKVRDLLYEIKSLVWDLGPGTNQGVKYDDAADVLYDIHQVIRHYLWQLKPEPKEHIGNHASRAMKFGSQPLVNIEPLNKISKDGK